jgi:hypothetical protein
MGRPAIWTLPAIGIFCTAFPAAEAAGASFVLAIWLGDGSGSVATVLGVFLLSLGLELALLSPPDFAI